MEKGRLGILVIGVIAFSLFSFSQNAFAGVPVVPNVSINDRQILEGNSGTTLFEFRVTSDSQLTITFSTSDGTATEADNDYTGSSDSLLLTPDINGRGFTGTITVVVNGDTNPENDETFFVNISGCDIECNFDAQAVGTILNDDVSCEPGFVIDPDTLECVEPPECEPGLVFDPEEGECVESVPEVTSETAYVSGSTSWSDNFDNGAIGTVDFGTGQIDQVGGQITEGGLSGITFDSNTDLFASSVDGGSSPSKLYKIDPASGDVILVFDITTSGMIEGNPVSASAKIRDLATQPSTDVIFGLGQGIVGPGVSIDGGCENFGPGNSIFTIDKSNGEADCIGTLDIDGVVEAKFGGIAFAPDGTLYATGQGCVDNGEGCDFENFVASFNPDASFAGFFKEIDLFLDGLGIRTSDSAFYGTIAEAADSVHSINLETGETPAVAGVGDYPADITFFPFTPEETFTPGGGGDLFQNPTLGKLNDGRLILSDGFCFDIFCMDVTDYFNHLPIQQVNSGSTHTISLTAYCSYGSNRCNYASVGAAPPGTDINSKLWNVVLQRIGTTDNWQVTKIDSNGLLGDVTGTVQIIDSSRIQYTFNIEFLTPSSIGTADGNAEPTEDNLILVTEIRDNNGGVARNIFNEGVFVNDIYAYPHIETSYAAPLEVTPLCLNEDSTDRKTCAFELVRQWTIHQAEEKLKEIYAQNHYKTD